MPGAHPLRHRDRAFPDETAGCTDGDCLAASCSTSASISRGSPASSTRSLDKLKTGNARTPAFSPSLLKMLTRSLDRRLARIRRGRRFAPASPSWRWSPMTSWSRLVRDVSKEFQKDRSPRRCARILPAIVADSRGGRATPARRRPRRRAGRRARRGQAGRQDAEPRSVHRQPDRERQARARSTRCWGAISRSARWSTS